MSDGCIVELRIRNLISVASKHVDTAKREVHKKLKENLMVWDHNVGGVLIKFYNIKLEKKLVELIEEQDFVNVPISYDAVYFNPTPNGTTYAEVTGLVDKILKIEVLGFIEGSIYMETGTKLKQGDLIPVKINQYFVKGGKYLVLDCQLAAES